MEKSKNLSGVAADPVTKSKLKIQAKTLRQYLGEEGVELSHSKCLDAIARVSGYQDWNTASALINKNEHSPGNAGERDILTPGPHAPKWLEFLTPWINHSGSDGRWVGFKGRYYSASRRWSALDDTSWRGLDFRIRKLLVSFDADGGCLISNLIISLLAKEEKGVPVKSSEWNDVLKMESDHSAGMPWHAMIARACRAETSNNEDIERSRLDDEMSETDLANMDQLEAAKIRTSRSRHESANSLASARRATRESDGDAEILHKMLMAWGPGEEKSDRLIDVILDAIETELTL